MVNEHLSKCLWFSGIECFGSPQDRRELLGSSHFGVKDQRRGSDQPTDIKARLGLRCWSIGRLDKAGEVPMAQRHGVIVVD